MIDFFAKWLPAPLEKPDTLPTSGRPLIPPNVVLGEADAVDGGAGDLSPNNDVMIALRYALDNLRKHKPGDRSEVDRAYAITITDLQKVIAFFEMAVIREDDGGLESMFCRLDDVMSGE